LKIVVLSVGRPRDELAAALHDIYAERIRKFGAAYDARFVAEVKAGGAYSDDHVMEREGRLLDEALDRAGNVVALDRSGVSLTTEELAGRLERWASPRVTFLVGGPLGLSPAIRKRAEFSWSLSALTFPHELARVLLAEQVYRALTILRHVPYHK
jgi:23S rRNA (pseudouridine1915-N3)-methyltransferase